MALTDAQQRVFGLKREELAKADWPDQYLLDTFVQMLITKLEAEGGLNDHHREIIKAFQDRYNWMAGLVSVNGLGIDPDLFSFGGIEINLEWIKWRSKQNAVDITVAAQEAVEKATQRIQHLQGRVEEMAAIAATKRYEPSENEPSIFGGERNSPGTDWLLWYSSTKKVSIIDAYEAGKQIMDGLFSELPRNFAGVKVPEMWVTSKELEKAGVKHRALSFRWVIATKYSRNLDWHETHADGIIMLHRS